MSDEALSALELVIRARRSVRRFKPEAPTRAAIGRLLDAAIHAPSASNQQPWKFLVVTRRPLIDAMASAVRGAVDRVARHVRPHFEPAFRAYGDYFTRFEAAPAVIIVLAHAQETLGHLVDESLEPGDREAIQRMERDSGLIGASLAIQNLLLAAHAMGLGASGMTGPLVAAPALSELLAVPPAWQIVALVPIGYPDEEPGATDRKPLDKVVRWVD